MEKVQLILEGGGMRGAYTAGVLDCFIDHNIVFENIIGVSAGAANATAYLSKEKGRSLFILHKYAHDKRYLSYRGLLRRGSIFGMNFIFNEIPNKWFPYDYDTAKLSRSKLEVVITNVETGLAEYHTIQDLKSEMDYLVASSSLPLVSKMVKIDDHFYLDGGLADALPLEHSIKSGYSFQVFVLTRPRGYQKKQSKLMRLSTIKYKRYPALLHTMRNRSTRYNKTLEMIYSLEKQGRAFVISPTKEITMNRIEKDKEKLQELYDLGYKDAKDQMVEILNLAKRSTNIHIEEGPKL